jgi:hypothetical protein
LHTHLLIRCTLCLVCLENFKKDRSIFNPPFYTPLDQSLLDPTIGIRA